MEARGEEDRIAMTPERYAEFTRRLGETLARDDRVVGLVALGSMAAVDYGPDAWSDHDFFVVVGEGEQDAFRADLSWLPEAERIAFSFRETEHGVKAVYDDAHLVEFAVFDDRELDLARVNRYRVLLDRGGLERRMRVVREATVRAGERSARDDRWLFGQFLTNLLVGVGRYRRGERLSGSLFVRTHAAGHLLVLLARHVPSARAALLDDLDAWRRFDVVYEALGREIAALLGEDAPAAAAGLIEVAARELAPRAAEFPAEAFAIVRSFLRSGER
jgi:hypothetical protein